MKLTVIPFALFLLLCCSLTSPPMPPRPPDPSKKGSKKRKASLEPADPNQPAKKKAKPATKVTKGRLKGPVDLDKQCGVINDKNLPCSRSLTCKSHSMGAKRAVPGRSRNYDELLIEWQRAHNPNWVEPVKKETKAEKKEKKDREKAEKKRLALEAAAAAGGDTPKKAPATAAVGGTKKGGKKAAAAAAAAVRRTDVLVDDDVENLDDLDSEAEIEDLIRSVRDATERGVIAVPLAVPCDAGSWFVARRERKRCCKDLLLGALGNSINNAATVTPTVQVNANTAPVPISRPAPIVNGTRTMATHEVFR